MEQPERVQLTLPAQLAGTDARRYEVTLIQAGDALNGWRFPAPVLQAAAPRFEGAASFVDHVGW
jgi:hypothetical protein